MSVTMSAPTATTSAILQSRSPFIPMPTYTSQPSSSTAVGQKSHDPVITIVAIVCCIGLLGFGIGYLRLRQMRRTKCLSPNTPPSTTATDTHHDHDVEANSSGAYSSQQPGKLNPSQCHLTFPLYTRHTVIPHLSPLPVESPPSYEELDRQRPLPSDQSQS